MQLNKQKLAHLYRDGIKNWHQPAQDELTTAGQRLENDARRDFKSGGLNRLKYVK